MSHDKTAGDPFKVHINNSVPKMEPWVTPHDM